MSGPCALPRLPIPLNEGASCVAANGGRSERRIPIGDLAAGVFAAFAVCAALVAVPIGPGTFPSVR